jgi:hypothetical protein
MPKREASPQADDRPVTKSRLRWPSGRYQIDQTHQGSQPQVDFHRILILVPFIRVTDHRRGEDGAAEVKIECNAWVNREYLEKLESSLKQLEEQWRMMDKDLYALSTIHL